MIRRYARPYARAVMEVADTPADARALHDELQGFESVRRRTPELVEMFANPGIAVDDKIAVSGTIGQRLALSALSLRILEVLVRNHRMNQLGEILEALRQMVNDALGVSVAQVRSAMELDEREKSQLQTTLEQRFGEKIDLELQTDPDLLGGFVAQIGSEVYDASVRRRLNKLKNRSRDPFSILIFIINSIHRIDHEFLESIWRST